MVANGEFRQDLFYRLQVVTLKAPPLRERRDDIPTLARRFLEAACEGAAFGGPATAAIAALECVRAQGGEAELVDAFGEADPERVKAQEEFLASLLQ